MVMTKVRISLPSIEVSPIAKILFICFYSAIHFVSVAVKQKHIIIIEKNFLYHVMSQDE